LTAIKSDYTSYQNLTCSDTSIIINLLALFFHQTPRCLPFHQPQLFPVLVLSASPKQLYGTVCHLPLYESIVTTPVYVPTKGTSLSTRLWLTMAASGIIVII